mgnify:CR=1 FL=1
MSTIEIVLGVALGISEALALIPSVKANSIFQVVLTVLEKLKGK